MSGAHETWRLVPGFAGYEVSDTGRVRGWRGSRGFPLNAPRVLRQCLTRGGYPRIQYRRDGHRFIVPVHRWVALSFIGPRPPGATINHRDGVKTNNRAENLEYVTVAENCRHAVRMGLSPTGERHHAARLSAADVAVCRDAYRARTVTLNDLAARYGVSESTVRRAVRGDTWTVIDGAQPAKTTCLNGHPRSPANTIVVGGKKRCLQCRTASQRAWIARESAKRRDVRGQSTAA